jgi:hypothetical protein
MGVCKSLAYNNRSPSKNKWLLENCNVKESWKLMRDDCEMKHISPESYYFNFYRTCHANFTYALARYSFNFFKEGNLIAMCANYD